MLVLAWYALFIVVCVFWRAWYQRRLTGSSGLDGLGLDGLGRASNAVANVAAGLLVSGHVLIVGYPILGVLGRVEVPPVPRLQIAAGVALMASTLVLVVVAQLQMGASWRIAVVEESRTDLVERGLFARIRNPIFTGVMAMAVGATILMPGWPMLLGTALIVLGFEVQVRLVEEPYLARVHGDAYRRYRARVGRFLPGIGRG